jgi:hypothetical protein
MSCSSVDKYQHFEETCYLHLQGSGIYVSNYMVSHSGKL